MASRPALQEMLKEVFQSKMRADRSLDIHRRMESTGSGKQGKSKPTQTAGYV